MTVPSNSPAQPAAAPFTPEPMGFLADEIGYECALPFLGAVSDERDTAPTFGATSRGHDSHG